METKKIQDMITDVGADVTPDDVMGFMQNEDLMRIHAALKRIPGTGKSLFWKQAFGEKEAECAFIVSELQMKYRIKPELILIPAGEFLMGSDPEQDKGAYEDEKPQHRVYLPDYYIAKTPTTNAQYAAFVDATGHRTPEHWKLGKPPRGKEDHPVVNVSWDDALAYCEWLATVTGKPYRLPTEAEWEKAARGTDGQLYPWGDEFDAGKCNTQESDIGNTTPVGRYSPEGDSPYGCVDMAGNVWEWTSSLFKDYPYQADDGREDEEAGGAQVLRGGSFIADQGGARCALRYDGDPNLLYWDGGFRVVYPCER